MGGMNMMLLPRPYLRRPVALDVRDDNPAAMTRPGVQKSLRQHDCRLDECSDLRVVVDSRAAEGGTVLYVDTSEWIGIGAFGQLAGLTVETLRHYHQTGLLVPAEVDERTAYRRYRMSQLALARRLAALRNVGMPLDQVAELLALTDPAARQARLLAHRHRLVDLARRANSRVVSMDRMIEKVIAMSADSAIGGMPHNLTRSRGRCSTPSRTSGSTRRLTSSPTTWSK